MRITPVHRLFVLAVSVFFLIAYFNIPTEGISTVTGEYPLFQKGMSYVTWNRESFGGAKSDESLRLMSVTGIQCVAIVPTWYQQTFDATEIAENEERTPSDESVRHAIRKAHEYGMRVMLKPHIDLIEGDSNSRADIGFQAEEKWRAWFDQYTAFITHYARMAEKEGVEFFCVGTELSYAATKTDYWKEELIPAVRKNFSGQLTYAANWDDYKEPQFWDDLDYAGIDAYFPLTKENNPSVADLKAGWEKWLTEIELWQRTVKKPILFTEAGYCSVDAAAKKPWEENRAASVDMETQANCYKALFETFWNKPWFFGIYWWNWNTYPGSGGPANKLFTPQNKPALDEMKGWYAQVFDKKAQFETYLAHLFGDREVEERAALESTHTAQAKKIPGVTTSSELARKTKRIGAP